MKTICVLTLLCAFLAGCTDAETPTPQPVEPSVELSGLRLMPADASVGGKSPTEWATDYIRWSYSQTTCETPSVDGDGSLCGLYQDSDSPVFFFERSGYDNAPPPLETRTRCRVPAGKALLVPLVLVAIDNVGAIEPLPNEELEAAAVDLKDSMRDLVLKADGDNMTDFEGRSVGPLEIEYRVPPAPNYFTCSEIDEIEDTVITSYMTGVVVLFEPPEPGPHELEYGSVFTYLGGAFAYRVRAGFTVDDPE
jgi:hypothetical protein